MRGRGRPGRKINYDGNEIQRANQSLIQAIEHGTLRWMKAKFEHCALEAVPNVWEGDEGMMKHVPKFPMPPLISLPEQPAADDSKVSTPNKPAEGGPEASEMSDDGDLDIPKPTEEIEPKFKKHANERYFWTKMAKVFMKLEDINQAIIRARAKFFSEHETVRRQTCQQLAKIYKNLKAIKGKLDAAEEEFNTNEYMNLFKVMPLNAKLKFKRYHNIEGRLPLNLTCIVKKHTAVKRKIREILHKHSTILLPFKDILSSTIADVLSKSNEKDIGVLNLFGDLGQNENGSAEGAPSTDADKTGELPVSGVIVSKTLLSDDEEDDDDDAELEPKKRKLAGAEGDAAQSTNDTQASNVVVSKEDIFWNSVAELKRRMNNIVISLSKADKVTLPETSRLRKNVSMSFCKQMLTFHRKISTFVRSLNRLKEEMETENYEDRKLFTAEDLTSQGIEDVTPDNSLVVIEACLNKLKNEYLRVRVEKQNILEKFGYSADVDALVFPLDKNVLLVRVCVHSKTEINANTLYGLTHDGESNNQTSTDQNGADQEMDQASSLGADKDGQQTAGAEATAVVGGEATAVATTPEVDVSGGGNADGDDASEESEPEDPSEVSKNANSLGFFMKNLGPDAFIVTEQASSGHVTEEFIEKEKQHWDQMQKFLRKIDRAFKLVRNKGKNSYVGKKQMKAAVASMRDKVKGFYRSYELAKTESFRAGYCKHVTYLNLEFQTQSSVKVLVKSLDQIKDRIDNLYGLYKETSKRMGLLHIFKL